MRFENGVRMKIGYARVSTGDQVLDGQVDQLKEAGADQVHVEIASGARSDRPVLSDVMKHVRPGDTLMVMKLDRLARSLPDLIAMAQALRDGGVDLVSLTEGLDTKSPGGLLVFHVLGAVGQFERDLIRERTRAGLAAAKSRGRMGGRPRKMSTEKVTAANTLLRDGTPPRDVAALMGVSIPTLFRWCPASQRSASGAIT